MSLKTIQLQGIGSLPGFPASTLRPGDILSWNYSYHEYRVLRVRDKSPQFLEIDEQNVKTGVVSTRRLKKDRLVAVYRVPA